MNFGKIRCREESWFDFFTDETAGSVRTMSPKAPERIIVTVSKLIAIRKMLPLNDTLLPNQNRKVSFL